MFNPDLSERIAHEQYKDRLREAEQRRLVEAAIAGQRAARSELRTSLGDLLLSSRNLFKVLGRRLAAKSTV